MKNPPRQLQTGPKPSKQETTQICRSRTEQTTSDGGRRQRHETATTRDRATTEYQSNDETSSDRRQHKAEAATDRNSQRQKASISCSRTEASETPSTRLNRPSTECGLHAGTRKRHHAERNRESDWSANPVAETSAPRVPLLKHDPVETFSTRRRGPASYQHRMPTETVASRTRDSDVRQPIVSQERTSRWSAKNGTAETNWTKAEEDRRPAAKQPPASSGKQPPRTVENSGNPHGRKAPAKNLLRKRFAASNASAEPMGSSARSKLARQARNAMTPAKLVLFFKFVDASVLKRISVPAQP